jgi:hypothetical protein
MKNRWWRIIVGEIILLLVTLLGFWVISVIPSKMTVETTSDSVEIFKKLEEINIFRESFIAKSDNLNRMEVLFKNPNLESRDELEIVLRDANGLVVGQQNFSGFNLGDTSHARMDLTPIVDSKNKEYILEIVPIKIIDGKLSFGIKGGHLDFIQYYGSSFGGKNSINDVKEIMTKIVEYQPVVLILPMVFLGMWLW